MGAAVDAVGERYESEKMKGKGRAQVENLHAFRTCEIARNVG